MKLNKYVIIAVVLCFFGWTSACTDTGTNTAVNLPAVSNTANANQAPVNTTEMPKTDTDISTGDSLASPSDAYKAAYNARQKKDLEALKKVMSKDALEFFTMMGGGETPDDGLKQLMERPQAATAETRSEKIDGNKATLEYLDEKGEWRMMDFEKEGADWKLTIPKPDKNDAGDKDKK